ncbi:MAG: cell division protein ZapA [Elusimicrobiales bacterium]|jgi:cell division protein ZapA (FtsZ GTPase activity inhibitor)
MQNNEVVIKIKGRSLAVSVDGLTELEIANIADQVEKKMSEIEEKTNTADTSKLAVMAALEFATELYNLKQKSENNSGADSRRIEDLVAKLEGALEKPLF